MKYLLDNDMDYSLRLRMLYTPVQQAETLINWGNLNISINLEGSITVDTGAFKEVIYPDAPLIWLDIVKNVGTYNIYYNGAIATTHAESEVYSPFLLVGSSYSIDTLQIWPEYLADNTDIEDDYDTVEAEQLFCDYNKNTLMRSRCNVTAYVLGGTNTIFIKEQGGTGSPQANKTNFILRNQAGQFADDQYGSFDPETGNYNGTTDERFLRQKVGIETEVKIGAEIEPLFRGRVSDSRFPRTEVAGKVNKVSITASDMSEILAFREVKTTRYYEEHFLSSENEDVSLFHKLATLALEHEISELLHNTAFNTGTLSPWDDMGTGTITSGGIFGNKVTMTGDILSQFVTDITIRAGEVYYLDIYLSGSSAEVYIESYYDGYIQDSVIVTFSPDLKVKRYRSIFKAVTQADSITISISGNFEIHGANLSRQSPIIFIDNADGDSATDNNITYQSYMPVGLRISPQLYQQGFSVIRPGSIWDYLKQMHVAGIGMYLGFSKGGVFEWKNYTKDLDNLGSFPQYTNLRQIVTMLSKEFNIMTIAGVEITKYSRGVRKLVFTSEDSAMQITEDIFDDASTSVQLAIQNVYNQEENVCDLIYSGQSAPTEKLYGTGYTVELKEESE